MFIIPIGYNLKLNNMDKDIEFIYSEAMKLLLDKEAHHKQFFTQEEYIKNIAIISMLSKAKGNVYKKITE